MGNIFKIVIVAIVLFFAFGFVYRVLFKLGILALIILAGFYLYKQVFAKK